MKKFAILAAVVAFIGCAQNDEGLDNITSTPEKSQTEFYASMPECDTRTYVEDNKYLRWNAGDEITVFTGNSYNSHWQFAGEDGANSGKFNEIGEGGFVTGTSLDLTANYAIYPYDENITISESGVVTLTLPAVQEYNHAYENSFGAGANTMMAVTRNTSDNFLLFKNLCGYLKLKFYGENVTVKSVTVKGNNGEKIAGKATVSMAYGSEPTITMGGDATDTITIDCGEGVALSNDAANPTTFWVAIPEITFEGGITIEVTDINDQTFEKKTTNAVPIENNLIQPMATLGTEFGPVEIPDTWKINYTATAKVTPYNENAFGVNIVSNEWDETTGEGVITFDGEVTKIGANAFKNCTALKEIVIDNSIIEIGASAFYGCSGLTSTTVGASVQKIGLLAFENCTGKLIVKSNHDYYNLKNDTINGVFYKSKFTTVVIEEGVTVIGQDAFNNCPVTSLTLPSTLKIIRQRAFSQINIQSLTIPESVSTIETEGFSWCDNLKNVYLNPSTPPATGSYANGYESNWRAFYQCNGVGITVPDEAYDKYIETEGWRYYAYFFLKQGEKLDDPNRISNRMIWYTNTNNTNISVQQYKWEGYNYWGDATMLFAHYDTYNKIGFLVFDKDLTAITGDSGVFEHGGTTGSTTFTLPGSLVYIEPRSFSFADVENFYGPLATQDNRAIVLGTTLNAYANCNTETTYTIPDGITRIEESAFEGWSYLRSVTIPDSVTSIGKSAFNGQRQYLSQVNIGSGIENIGDLAFSGCSSLSKIYCKALTPPVLGAYVFDNNHPDRKFYVPYVNYSTTYYEKAEGWSEYKNYIYGVTSFEY